MTRACSDCSAVISAGAKTGRCRKCAARAIQADPAFRERLLAGLRRTQARPEHRAKIGAGVRRMNAERADDPDWRARKEAQGRRLRRDYDASPTAAAANLARRADVGRQVSAQRLAWCPEEHRDEYQRLRRTLGAAEARRVILDHIARETPRPTPKRPLTFEEQLARVAAGAALVATPNTRSAASDFTLGGVASGLL